MKEGALKKKNIPDLTLYPVNSKIYVECNMLNEIKEVSGKCG